jgi:hypothetical protein
MISRQGWWTPAGLIAAVGLAYGDAGPTSCPGRSVVLALPGTRPNERTTDPQLGGLRHHLGNARIRHGEGLVVVRLDQLLWPRMRTFAMIQGAFPAGGGAAPGRKPRIDPATVRRLREAQRLGPAAIAGLPGIGGAGVDRVLGKRPAA